MKTIRALLCCQVLLAAGAAGEEPIAIQSPGFPPSQMDAQGRLVEDWGTVAVRLVGEGVVEGATTISPATLDKVIPAALAVSDRGTVRLICTAFRAPAFPAGIDVLTVRLEETQGKAADVLVALDLPEGTIMGRRTVRLGGRTILTLPAETTRDQPLRDWGYADEASTLRGWAKPAKKCDPAFANIRAGMGGVPIVYRFTVTPRSAAKVMLGFCESHWAERGQRPVSCRVEGADPLTVDPVAQWGQHQPGLLVFDARDQNGDGRLDVVVRPGPNAPDRNPILNAIWIFPPGETPSAEKLMAGDLSAAAIHYVDVGGDNDQSIYPPGKLEYRVTLAAGDAAELTFFVACPGGSAPIPDIDTWTSESLRRAARDVWRDWK